MTVVDNTNARQSTNRKNARMFAQVGLYVFPSDGKVPLIPRYNRADTSLSKAEREAAIEEYIEKHGVEPVHVGSTKDDKVLVKLWRKFPNAVPSISCGPSKLVVLDADQKDDGPAKLRALFDENEGPPAGVAINPTKSGGEHFVFRDPDGKFSNRAGLLKKEYGTDVRGTGGQFVAPGSIREDGATYGTQVDKQNFIRAVVNTSMPTLPPYVVELIGATGGDVQGEDVTPTKEREVIKSLEEADWDTHADDFDATLGKYDIAALKADNADFAKLYDAPGTDCSANRFLAARHVMREWPDMPASALAYFLAQWDGAGVWTDEKPATGEYDTRQIAREWIKNQGLTKAYHSDGSAFDAVQDDAVEEREAFIANGGSAERWDALHEQYEARLAAQRDRRNVDQSTEAQGSKPDRRKIVHLEDIQSGELPHIEWAVKNVIPLGTTGFAVGAWGSGKTAVLLDIGLRIAHGMPFAGRRVKKGSVLYVGLENPLEVERRIRAWLLDAGETAHGGAFALHRGPLSLYSADGKPTVDERELIKLAKSVKDRNDLPVSLIVLDTLAQSIMPGDDNSAKDASIYTAAMQRIADATGACVIALAHPTKSDRGAGVRGSGAWEANVDIVFAISRDERGRGRFKAGSKFRVGDPAKVDFTFRLHGVGIGADEDGEPISAVVAKAGNDIAVAEAVDGADDEPMPVPPDTPADKLRAALRVIRERVESIAAETGETPEEIGLSAQAIREALNVDRRRSGLPELKERTTVPKLLAKLVEAREIVKLGDNRRTHYRLTSISGRIST